MTFFAYGGISKKKVFVVVELVGYCVKKYEHINFSLNLK